MRACLPALMIGCCLPPVVAAGEVPFSDPRWAFEGETAEVVTVNGREALHLFNGRATLEADFEDGVIEYDLLVTPERGFHGVEFRVLDDRNAERFYIRPHQSGNPDANQYTPVFNGLPGWQLYYGPRFSAPIDYRIGEWMHHRIVISGGEADVYIDSDEPVLHIGNLKQRHAAGDVRIFSGYAPAHFADFRIERQGTPDIVGTAPPGPAPEPGTVATWQVSSAFDGASLSGTTTLADEHLRGLTWDRLDTEDRGYANLARRASPAPPNDTVFARLRIRARESMTRVIRFGYSDRVRVYLNGELLYLGDNGYRTRDYRYLGTIGLFDSVPLRLEKGDNELLFAVSESFGGWGIMARLDNRAGLTLEQSK